MSEAVETTYGKGLTALRLQIEDVKKRAEVVGANMEKSMSEQNLVSIVKGGMKSVDVRDYLMNEIHKKTELQKKDIAGNEAIDTILKASSGRERWEALRKLRERGIV